MAQITFAAQTKVHPSFSEPDAILTYAQPSGAFELLENSTPRVKIGSGDLNVYVNSIDVRTQALNSQFSPMQLPSASLAATYGQTQTYNVMVRAEYGPDDTQAASAYDVSLPQMLDFAGEQGIFQALRTMLLYGVTPGNNEGLVNSPDATSVTLPADPLGNTSVRTYDNGAMAFWLLSNVQQLVQGMYQTGLQAKGRIVLVGPQRVLLYWSMVGIVQVTSYQRVGAGTETTAGVVKAQAELQGYDLEWFFDDTLIGKGAGGTDLVLVSMPEIEVPSIPQFNTDQFGQTKPSMNAVNLQYLDMVKPQKIPTPIPDGAITEVQKLRASCGWNVRPQGLYLLNLPY